MYKKSQFTRFRFWDEDSEISNSTIRELINLRFLDLGRSNIITLEGVSTLINLNSLLNIGNNIKESELKSLTSLTELS
jgi:hypothetical protein